MTARIFLKLILGVFCLLAVAIVAVDFFASKVAEANYIQNIRRELGEKARMMASVAGPQVSTLDRALVAKLATSGQARVTIIDSNGKVLADSEANPDAMDNHSSRPEFQKALAGQEGSLIRRSSTLKTDFLYVAEPIPGGAIRLAVPLSEINQHVDSIRWKMLTGTALAFVPAILIAAFLARRISEALGSIIEFAGELARGNFRASIGPIRDGDLSLLSAKLTETAENLQRTVEQLQIEHSELEKLERVRKDFVINMSHELRTPLASIQGYTETLMDGALADEANNMRFLGIIRHNAERLTRLTADLLTLSRLELKTREFNVAHYEANRLIGDVVDTMRPIAARRDITLVHEVMPGAPEVFCDAEAMHQILSNLLDNAIKYTPEGGQIVIGSKLLQEPQQQPHLLEIFVRDSGVGIPAEDLPRLFERFYRVDKARSRELGGTGLGLAIVKHLVRSQGGDVRVESVLNQGSTFFFSLPTEDPSLPPQTEFHSEFTAS